MAERAENGAWRKDFTFPNREELKLGVRFLSTSINHVESCTAIAVVRLDAGGRGR